jgi:hypothetical protein
VTVRTVAVEDELASLVEADRPLEQAAREGLVLDLFRRRRIAIGKACELLRLDRSAFLLRSAELGSPVQLTTEQDFEADLAAVEAWRREPS